jgi:NAD(P)-dependent dehydrogenase (short-subunit alcohol dehydrogenase family)
LKILLTGGASGLGLIIFERLSACGHDVVFTYNRSLDQANLNINKYPNSKKIHCDFKNSDSVQQCIKKIQELDIDVLINNALPPINAIQFQKTKIDTLSDSFNHSVIPILKLTQACISHFRKKRSGRIITILTSYLINHSPNGYSEYVANKAYLYSMSKTWAKENFKFGIVVNNLAPSIMRTPLNDKVDERLLENLEKENPFGELLTPEDVAKVVNFLIDSPRQLNGINLILNGGKDVI